MSYEKMTVPQLRDEVRRAYTYEVDTASVQVPAGLSKMRKADLIELLDNAPRLSQTSETTEAHAFLAGALYEASDAAEFTPEQHLAQDEAKYRGRYEGKAVRVGDEVGKVVSWSHRDRAPFRGNGRTLLLSVQYSDTRVLLHAAEDVVLV